MGNNFRIATEIKTDQASWGDSRAGSAIRLRHS
jgi:hypothetical protein